MVPLSILVDIGSFVYALVTVFHPDWLIRSNFRLRRSDNLHKDSHKTRGYIHERKETRLAKRRNAYQTDDQKETRLANRRKAYETDDKKQTGLAKR